jgi:hypothetical protein
MDDMHAVDAPPALDALVHQASELNDEVGRLKAISELKALRLDRAGAHLLCDLLRSDTHPAVRTLAAQGLGYHRAALRFSEVEAELLRRADRESDPLTLRALVFALRDTHGILRFFSFNQENVVIEAVAGTPHDDVGLQALLGGIFGGVPDRVAQAMCVQMSKFESSEGGVVACLMAVDAVETAMQFEQRVLLAFRMLVQATLLDALTDVSGEIERTYQTIWPGIWRREQQRRLLEMFVQSVHTEGASKGLVQMLCERIGHDGAFYTRYVRFVRSLLLGFNLEDAQALVVACERVGCDANRDCLSRLAEALVVLVRGRPDVASAVQGLLGVWEQHLPGIQMQAFHASR